MKTRHHPRFKYDAQASAVDVALATSAAPTYFAAAPFPTHQNASYVDGGVWANSPALVAIVEAMSFLGKRSSDIDVLSIGTTATPFNVAKRGRAGLLRWNTGLLDLALTAQAEAALAQASLLVQGRLLRINTITAAGQFSLDDSRIGTIAQLASLGRGEAVKKSTLDPVTQRFLNGIKAEPFIPHA